MAKKPNKFTYCLKNTVERRSIFRFAIRGKIKETGNCLQLSRKSVILFRVRIRIMGTTSRKTNTATRGGRGRGRGTGSGTPKAVKKGRSPILKSTLATLVEARLSNQLTSEKPPANNAHEEMEDVIEKFDARLDKLPEEGIAKDPEISVQEVETSDNNSVQSESTVKQTNQFKTRLSVNLFTLPSPDRPDQVLFEAGKKWFSKMKDADAACKILPWFDDAISEAPIHSFKDIPSSLFIFKKYFSRARPSDKGGKVYTDVMITHSRPIDELKDDLDWWLRREQVDMFVKTIQADRSSRLGWLLFSFQELNLKVLSTELSELASTEISAIFKPILTGTWDPSIDPKKRLKAVHLECAKKYERKAMAILNLYYSSSSTQFPLGIRMRLVPEYNDIKGNHNTVRKVANLRAKQTHFLMAMNHVSSDDIINLDIITSSSDKTLRELIMGISNWGTSEATLFHAVNESWDKSKVIFTFSPSFADNANLVIQGLIPILISRYGDKVREFFHPDALSVKEEWLWDENKKELDNPQSRAIEALVDGDTDFDFKGCTGVSKADEVTSPLRIEESAEALTSSHLDRVLAGIDTDSVSTLGNPLTASSRFTPKAIGTIIGGHNEHFSPTHSVSGYSQSSLDSRVSGIESRMSSLESTIKSNMEEMFKLMNKSSMKPAGGEKPGSDP